MTESPGEDDVAAPLWVRISGVVVIALVLALVVVHLTGNGFGGHTP
ncbi:hypothetical protein ABTZ99_17725 [Actinosynnema sp. NPDC002837]